MSRKPLLILKAGEALAPVKADHGDFEDWIARGLGCSLDELDVASVYQGDLLPSPTSVRGVVITGSPFMVTDRADWSEASARWLAEIVRTDAAPILGLCYGHQLLAHALGGEVGANPNGREMGTHEVTVLGSDPDPDSEPPQGGGSQPAPRDEILASLFEPGVFPGHLSHVESVLKPPPGARVLARTALDPHSVLAFGPRQWGVQFHPEFDVPIMRSYVEARRDILTQEGFDPASMIESAYETPALSSVLSRFAELADEGD